MKLVARRLPLLIRVYYTNASGGGIERMLLRVEPVDLKTNECGLTFRTPTSTPTKELKEITTTWFNGNWIRNEIIRGCDGATAAPTVRLITRAIDYGVTYSRPSLDLGAASRFKTGIRDQFLAHGWNLLPLQLVNMNAF
jgi:hypothetical protein